MASASDVTNALAHLAKPEKKEILQRFFKTGPGEYGEGDVFLGVMVPQQRSVAKRYKDLSLLEVQKLLDSKVHEHRLTGLLILVYQYEVADVHEKSEIYAFYLKNAKRINNWDLVDVSAPNIVGNWLLSQPVAAQNKTLDTLASSQVLWENRIAVLSTFAFIRAKNYTHTLRLSKRFMTHDHDLMHKACGWMLREVGKRDQAALEEFLAKNAKQMPRTMLRYAIEKFDEKKRRLYLSK